MREQPCGCLHPVQVVKQVFRVLNTCLGISLVNSLVVKQVFNTLNPCCTNLNRVQAAVGQLRQQTTVLPTVPHASPSAACIHISYQKSVGHATAITATVPAAAAIPISIFDQVMVGCSRGTRGIDVVLLRPTLCAFYNAFTEAVWTT